MHTTEWDRDLLRETLHEIMRRADLTQAAVGKLAGRDRTMANRWLNGRHQPNYEAAARFAAAISQQRPDLTGLVRQFLAAAGYPPAASDNEPSDADSVRSAMAEDVLNQLRELARRQDKTIGDILVERGLATPADLTLSDEKRHDPIVRDILASDLPEETKNVLLLEYAGRRREEFKKAGAEKLKAPQKKPRGT